MRYDESIMLGHLKTELEPLGFRDAELVRIIAACATRGQLFASGMGSEINGGRPAVNERRELIPSKFWRIVERGVTNHDLHSSRVLDGANWSERLFHYVSEVGPEPAEQFGTVTSIRYTIDWQLNCLIVDFERPVSGLQMRWGGIEFDAVSVRQFLSWIASRRAGTVVSDEEVKAWIRGAVPEYNQKTGWKPFEDHFGPRRPIKKVYNSYWNAIHQRGRGAPKKS